MTRLFVIGHPVAHSLSPAMHGAALAALATTEAHDVTYERRDVTSEGLAQFVVEARSDPSVLGFNVTSPHKVAIQPLLDALEPSAIQIGAVNTVVKEARGLVGLNTDAAGLARSLAEAGVVVADKRAVIIGSGGAARAALWALRDASEITVTARDQEAARTVAALRPGARVVPLVGPELAELRADVWIQATSAPLEPSAGEALAELLPLAAQSPGTVVVDLVYRPQTTAVLTRAHALGLVTVDGTGMLVHQGAFALERWLGVKAPVPVMRAALLSALDGH